MTMKRSAIAAITLLVLSGVWFYWDSRAEFRKANRINAAIEDYRTTHGRLPNPRNQEVMMSLGFELRTGWHPDFRVETEKGLYRITIIDGTDGPYWTYDEITRTWRRNTLHRQ